MRESTIVRRAALALTEPLKHKGLNDAAEALEALAHAIGVEQKAVDDEEYRRRVDD